MPVVKVKCPDCGNTKVLREVGRYFWKCPFCNISRTFKDNIVSTGVSLKELRETRTIDITEWLEKENGQKA